MRRLRSARLARAVIVTALLLLLSGCSQSVGTPTATTAGAVTGTTPATPTRPAPPGTPPATPGFATPTKTSATRQATPLTGAAASLSRLTEASAITVQDDWSGLSFTSPVEEHYSLYREEGRFAGAGRLVVNHREVAVNGKQEQRVRTGEVSVPLDVMQTFLDTLATVPLREGAYEPKITHTDDYPMIDILIATPVGAVWFFTASNEVDNVPWGAVIGERTYIINSAIPTQALTALDRYLRLMSPENDRPISDAPPVCRTDAPSIKPVASTPAPAQLISYDRPTRSTTPRPRIGESINFAERYGLQPAEKMVISVLGKQRIVKDRAFEAQLITLLDRPLVVIPSASLGPSYFDRIDFTLSSATDVWVAIHYHSASDEIYLRTSQYYAEGEIVFAVRAPAGVKALLLSQLCAP